MEDFSEIVEIWRGELTRALKGGRALALVVLFVLFEALLLTVVGFVTSSASAQVGGGAPPTGDMLQQKRMLLQLVTNNSEATLDVIAKLPMMLLFSFFTTGLLTPMLVALMGFDQLAGEIAPKSMRYLIVRVRRSSIILGKYLSQVTLLSGLLLLCMLAIVLTTKYVNADFGWPDTVRWAFKLSAAAIVVGLAYAALTALCSAVAGQSALALFLNFMLLIVFWFVGLLSYRVRLPGAAAAGMLDQAKEESVLGYLRYLTPSEFDRHLLSPQPLEFATGLVAYLGFALLFLGAAQLVLRNKDL